MPDRGRSGKRSRLRAALICVGLIVLIPIVIAVWLRRGDPDIRPDLHRAYLESVETPRVENPPNVVLIFADDLGYGDVSSFGSGAISTPHLDGLATDGIRLTNFYSASPVCSPSRFSLLTGRYPTRGFIHSVFFPSNTLMGRLVHAFGFPHGIRGIPADEVTLAEALRAGGYTTGMFGKWHLGDRSPNLPNDKGFDYFFGTYYSNDMTPYAYYRNEELAIEPPADQSTLTRRLTGEVVEFIDANADQPFLVYYASPFPHHPVHSSGQFTGRSQAGSYGDCVEELDWSVGQIRSKLAESDVADNTLILFLSDNGPWYEGSPGHHRGRKANNLDGGQIVPFLATWPARIPRGRVVAAPAMSIDLFPTILAAAGIGPPSDRLIDGIDLGPVLTGESDSPLDRPLFFVKGGDFVGVRTPDDLKYLAAQRSENSSYWIARQGPFLFDLRLDPTESYDLSGSNPGDSDRLAGLVQRMNEGNLSNPRGWADASD